MMEILLTHRDLLYHTRLKLVQQINLSLFSQFQTWVIEPKLPWKLIWRSLEPSRKSFCRARWSTTKLLSSSTMESIHWGCSELDDNKIYVSLQASETFLNASRSIMLCKVGHAPEFAFDSHDVWIHFSQFGVITNLTPPNQNLGNDGYEFCFLKFLDYASASKALSASPHNFGSVWVVARKAKDF